jgi:hypothetical protein
VEDDVGAIHRALHVGVVAHVADDEMQPLRAVGVDDVVGGGGTVLERQAHVVLLGLVTGEDREGGGHALAAVEDPGGETLTEGAGTAEDDDVGAVERMSHQFCDRSCW